MSKVIKEIIIMLLVCLVVMLLFAVIFYEYIPNRKIVPEVAEYKASEKVKELLADDVDKRNDTIVKTFEVTSADLNNYKITNEYVPGKANPFASVIQDPETGAKANTTTSGNTTTQPTEENTSTEQINTSTTNTSSGRLIENEGTK